MDAAKREASNEPSMTTRAAIVTWRDRFITLRHPDYANCGRAQTTLCAGTTSTKHSAAVRFSTLVVRHFWQPITVAKALNYLSGSCLRKSSRGFECLKNCL